MDAVEVDGQPIAVKLARHDGDSSTRSPSTTTSPARPPRSAVRSSDVLAAAIAATHALLEERR